MVKVYGRCRVKGFQRDECIYDSDFSNIVTESGLVLIVNSLISAQAADLQYIGVGSSSFVEEKTQTDLLDPIPPRKAVTERFRSGTTASFAAFFGSADNNGDWNEIGLFDSASGGNMFARVVLSTTFKKDETKTATVVWDIGVS